MTPPHVSVVIPTYNSPGLLVQAIESVLTQTYRSFDVVVVDDGSTDDTAAVLSDYAGRGQIRYMRQDNWRQAAARNTGIRASRGELIAFLDHDDLWDERKLDRQVPLFADPGVALAYTGAREVDLVGNVLWEKGGEHFRRGQIFDHLLFNHFITCSTVVIRRSCLDEVGLFREDLWGVDDIHMWLRICYRHEADFVPDVLVSCRSHDANMKKDPWIIPEKRFLLLIDIFRELGLDRSRPSAWRKLNADREFFEGYRLRNRDRLRSLLFFLRSMRHEVRIVQFKAIAKLLVPYYYAIGDRLAERRGAGPGS